MVKSLFISNRGEIAARIARTAREMGIHTVGLYSEADARGVHVGACDEAVGLEGNMAGETYLDIGRVVSAAVQAGCDAVHPGYGFLSENAAFAEAVEAAGLTFVGPTAAAIRAMGSKQQAKGLLEGHNATGRGVSVPVIPGYHGAAQSEGELEREAGKVGFPLLVKASAGGGGRGLRIARSPGEVAAAVRSARSEAESAFGDGTLLLERYFEHVRHVEFQILGDAHGNVVHLHERECSVQRRHQKVIEEAPCVALSAGMRRRMAEAAEQVARVIAYRGAGTVEFIADTRTEEFFFLEVNTRLQVEHPVTELVLGLDLVRLQLEVARGARLADLDLTRAPRGHAIEVRLCAEDPGNAFLPCVGPILRWDPARGVAGVRYDDGVRSASVISVYYDSMISKVIAYGPTRAAAIDRLVYALEHSVLLGLRTNLPFLVACLRHPRFASADLNTHFIAEEFPPDRLAAIAAPRPDPAAAVAATLYLWARRAAARTLLRNVPSGWRNNRSCDQLTLLRAADVPFDVHYRVVAEGATTTFDVRVGDSEPRRALLFAASPEGVDVEYDGRRRFYAAAAPELGRIFVGSRGGPSCDFSIRSRLYSDAAEASADSDAAYVAPMPARVLRRVAPDGEPVNPGDVLLVVESMKMEQTVKAKTSGVLHYRVKEGQLVDAGSTLLIIE